jgi:transposase
VRNGTLSLDAALEMATGRVEGKTAPRHTSAEFLTCLDQVVASAPKRKAIHLVVHNLSAHKTKTAQAWLAARPRATTHDTRTYSRWLHQIETWLARIGNDSIASGTFTSTTDLRTKQLHNIKPRDQTDPPPP